MTSEQVAELRKESERWVLTSTEKRLVPRLFDEREALLNALVGLEVWITKNVSGGARIEPLAVARQTLDKVCKP